MRSKLLLAALLLSGTAAFAQPVQPKHLIQVTRTPTGTANRSTGLQFDPALRPFYHGVASGDPSTTGFVIWTRVTPDTSSITSVSGTYQLATDTGFTNIIQNGSFSTDTAKDFTVNVICNGLQRGQVYYYRFRALNRYSLVGRARTLPDSNIQHLKMAVVSCQNFEGGYFNAYQGIAQRDDLDAVVHLGDYIYEYGAGAYGINLPNRINDPATEILTLSDYRTRYSLYRLDKDLIRAHQQHTFITVWDDHESANDSWTTGAENHQPNEGPWATRRDISKRVYFEWMPIRYNAPLQVYRQLKFGNLADLNMLDTRLEGRVQPPLHFDTPDTPSNPRLIMSNTQMNWLTGNLKTSSARWKLIGNQILYSFLNVGFGASNPTNIDSIRVLEDQFIDNWESYPIQRHRLLDSVKKNNISNIVLLTGDSHCSWGFDVPDTAVNYPNAMTMNIPTPKAYNPATKSGYNAATQEGSWMVEYGTPSISSPNFDEAFPPAVAAGFELAVNNPIPQLSGANYNPHLRYVDLDRHGYILFDVKMDSVQADFYYSRIDIPGAATNFGKALITRNNGNKVLQGMVASAPKAIQDAPTPIRPQVAQGVKDVAKQIVLFSAYPNPASDKMYLQFGLAKKQNMAVNAYDVTGRKVAALVPEQAFEAGVYNLALSLEPLSVSGAYIIVLESAEGRQALRVQVQK